MFRRRHSTGTTPIDDATENSPLLAPDSDPARLSRPWIRSSSSISAIILLAVVLVSFAGIAPLITLTLLIRSNWVADQIAESPETRIIESVICYRHYEQVDPSKINLSRDAVGPGAIGGVDEHWCKTAAIQNPLAELNGYRQLLDGIPALLLAIPFGWAADSPKCGRWPIVFLNLLHVTLRAGWVQVRESTCQEGLELIVSHTRPSPGTGKVWNDLGLRSVRPY